MNLLDETKHVMECEGLNAKDIIFIGSLDTGHSCTWEEFKVLANVHYNNGYGGQEVAKDLCIVFSNKTMLCRWEYDGSEGWEVRKPPVVPMELYPITKLIGGSWDTLKELNEE